jgi:hypothetical protein
MIRSIFAAAAVATAGLLVFAAPAVADDEEAPAPAPSLLQAIGVDPYVNICAGFSTPIPFIGVGGCSDDVSAMIGVG